MTMPEWLGATFQICVSEMRWQADLGRLAIERNVSIERQPRSEERSRELGPSEQGSRDARAGGLVICL